MTAATTYLHQFSESDRASPPEGTLRLYLAYRVVLALLLSAALLSGIGPAMLGSHAPRLFTLTTQAYLVLSVLSLALSYARAPARETLCYSAIFVDITVIVVLMHASGGVQSGLGTLLAVSIALASLSMGGRTALLFAALATLGVITEQGYAQLADSFSHTAYTHAGLLGVSYFALALLTYELSRRIRESERLAHQRGFDLANLAQLNDYVIQHMQAGVVVVDDNESVRLMNESAWYLLGMPEAVRGAPLQRVAPALAQQLHAWQADRDAERPAFRAVSGGRDLRADFAALGERGAQGRLIFLEDTALITERAQQLKLASLGQLTASIAHEIRNPLGAIAHAAQLLSESPDLPQPDQRLTEIICANTQRVNQVIENILKLSRRNRGRPKPLVLSPWLHDQLEELARDLGVAQEQVHLEVEPQGTTVYVDPAQLRQIITVLFDNAVRHFRGPHHALRLRVSAGITRESGGPFLDFMDNGSGIPGDAVGKLFEPFFTTRNDGTGLGLYVARELCETNRIRLEYLPVPAGGSCFRLSFPDPRNQEQTT
jgi:two-component system sensor histidine kinase PilS (NtrC family)